MEEIIYSDPIQRDIFITFAYCVTLKTAYEKYPEQIGTKEENVFQIGLS